MQDYSEQAADRLLEVIPAAMRNLAAELRRSKQNLEPTHFRLLAKLHHGRLSLGDLAQQFAVSAATMSRTVTTLEERGWVYRDTSPDDGRVVLVCLSDDGRAVLERMHRKAHEWIESQLRQLSEQELERLLDGLTILHSVVVRQNERKNEVR